MKIKEQTKHGTPASAFVCTADSRDGGDECNERAIVVIESDDGSWEGHASCGVDDHTDRATEGHIKDGGT